ncbi:MAG TPA: hypothetical protein VN811_00580 [Thermoanaerobaculia bacterium]|nr:hypothetical protein [Thermoanaerobaculia bacterium]HXT49500.1 hypothetical protein [Thermoanaerobaculia bacterium]
MRRRAALALLAVAVALPLRADTVRLKNGRAYEGVIAERVAQGVRVQLAFGYIVIPAEQVVGIEKAPSALASYLERKAALESRPATTAGDWLELARWAKVHDFPSASREAALLAAELDPRLPGLDALLRPLGLVYEEALGRWIPFAESMARRGLVPWNGEWITVAEQRERREEQERQHAARAQEAASRRLAEAAEAMRRTEERVAQREEMRLREAMLAANSYPVVYGPVMTFPGFWMPPVVVVVNPPAPGQPAPPGQQPPMQVEPRNTYGRLQSRQPGSLLPPYGEPIVAPELHHLPPPGVSATSSGS